MLSKHKLAIGAATVALAAGGGGAYAATRSNAPTRDAFLNDLAARLGTTRAKLDAALKGAASDQLDKAVAAGRLTRAQADAIRQRVQQGGPPFMLAPPVGPPGVVRLGFPGLVDSGAAARYLGLTPARLAEQTRSGKSLADVARAQGKSVTGLEQAMRAAMQARLDQAVKDGRLTSAQRDRMLKAFGQVVDDVVNRTPPPGPPLLLRRR